MVGGGFLSTSSSLSLPSYKGTVPTLTGEWELGTRAGRVGALVLLLCFTHDSTSQTLTTASPLRSTTSGMSAWSSSSASAVKITLL